MEQNTKKNVLIICHLPHHNPEIQNTQNHDIYFIDINAQNIKNVQQNNIEYISYTFKNRNQQITNYSYKTSKVKQIYNNWNDIDINIKFDYVFNIICDTNIFEKPIVHYVINKYNKFNNNNKIIQ